jgi:hypothetical protein
MTRTTMLHYLLQNGWRMISFNYVLSDANPNRPMDIVQAYVTQRHRERIKAHADATTKLETQGA